MSDVNVIAIAMKRQRDYVLLYTLAAIVALFCTECRSEHHLVGSSPLSSSSFHYAQQPAQQLLKSSSSQQQQQQQQQQQLQHAHLVHNLTAAKLIRQSNVRVVGLVDKSVALTCSIELDDVHFPITANYKVIWSRESDKGRDFEPIALDDTRLVPNQRLQPSRIVIARRTRQQIQWTLVISSLVLNDTNNYICQLNRPPFDVFWLRRFMLSVYGSYHFCFA